MHRLYRACGSGARILEDDLIMETGKESGMANLETVLCGRKMTSPFVLGSGPCGWDAKSLAACARAGCGAVVTKSITINGAVNTTRHMILNGPMSLLNNEGGSDMPLSRWRDYEIKQAKDLGVRVLIASVYGYGGLDDTLEIATSVESAGADMIELVNGYTEAADLIELLSALKKSVKIPIIAKVNGNWKDTEEIAKACDAAGADAITAIDSIGPTYRVDIATGQTLIGGNGYGYMTGAPILPIALRYVHDIAALTKKQIIGLGGVTNAESAMEMLMAGASAVGVCSAAIIKGPSIFIELINGLANLMDRYGYLDVEAVSGVTLRKASASEKTPKDFRFSDHLCTHCNRCINACAYRARTFDADGDMRVDEELCRVCGLCFGVCPRKAITID